MQSNRLTPILSAFFAASLLPASVAPAAVFNVADGDVPGLVTAITTANGNGVADTINLASGGTYTISLANNGAPGDENALPVITTDITLEGAGSLLERQAGAPDFRLIEVAFGGTLTVRDLTIANGKATFGGGIKATDCILNLETCVVEGNLAEDPIQAFGGGVYGNGADITILDSTIRQNTASALTAPTVTAEGGGLWVQAGTFFLTRSTVSGNQALIITPDPGSVASGGGIQITGTDGPHELENSTISGNMADSPMGMQARGGGIAVFRDLEIKNCTIAENAAVNSMADTGGGLYAVVSGVSGPVNLVNTLVALNTIGTGAGPDVVTGNPPSLVTLGYNLINNPTGSGVTWLATDITAPVTLGLSPLADYGGPTQTHALQPGSAAIDTANDTVLSAPQTDQRGSPRPQDGDGDLTATTDIGAFEMLAPVGVSDWMEMEY